MLDGRSRVTVVGARKRVDVALPSSAPIGEYSAGLANLCGQDRRGPMPAAWSLAVAGAPTLPLSTSLAESGIVDGQVLYLRDLARDPTTDLVVADIGELVGDEAETQRRRGWPRPAVAVGFGLAWLGATAGFALARPDASLIAPVCLVVAGLILLATAWGLTQRDASAPAALCVLTSLAAVPCIAAATAMLAQAVAGPSLFPVGAIAGATAAVLMGLAATPEAVLVLVAMQLGVALLLAALLAALRATRPEVAAATVLAMISLLGLSKLAAAFVTVSSSRRHVEAASRANRVTGLLIRSRMLLCVLVSGPALALAVSLSILAFSGNDIALAMAGVSGIALVVRGRQAGFTEEMVPIGGAGVVGLFGFVAAVADRIWHTGPAGTIALTVAGIALFAGGVIANALRTDGEAPPDMPPGFPAGAGPPNKPRKVIDIVGMLCTITIATLALAVFGVLQELMTMGRAIIG
jgi:hypothetical protein